MNAVTTSLQPPFEILAVRDTRAFEEIGDRWVAIAGSGDAVECDRCGRIHEIHAHVRDENGVEANVGVGCMNATTAEVRSLAGKATRTAVAAAREVARERARAELARLEADAAALTFDASAITVETPEQESVWVKHIWRYDDVQVWVSHSADRDERLRTLEDHWRLHRQREAAGGPDAFNTLRRKAAR